MALSSILGVLTDVGSYWQNVRPLLPPRQLSSPPSSTQTCTTESFTLVVQKAYSQRSTLHPRRRRLLRRMGGDRLRPRRAPTSRPLAPKCLVQILRLQAHERAAHCHHQCPRRRRYTRPRQSAEIGAGQEFGQHYDAEALQPGICGDETIDRRIYNASGTGGRVRHSPAYVAEL